MIYSYLKKISALILTTLLVGSVGTVSALTPKARLSFRVQSSRSTIEETVWTKTALNGIFLEKAVAEIDPLSQMPRVTLYFTPRGGRIFAQITERQIGKPLGIFVNNELISAPLVNQKITGGSAVIYGNFTLEEADQLAKELNGV